MRLPKEDWLFARGWDFYAEATASNGGTIKLYKSRRTGEIASKTKALNLQYRRDREDQLKYSRPKIK